MPGESMFQGGVPALAVVERLDVFEHGGLQLEARRPGAAVDELFLEGREERLGDGVVVRVYAGTHRDVDPGLVRGPAERERDVLAARSEWWMRPGSGRRRASAIWSEPTTRLERMWVAIHRATTSRE